MLPLVEPTSLKGDAMPTTTAFSARALGQTEKALNAILDRQLAGTGLTERQWITLTLTVTLAGGGAVDSDELGSRVAGALQLSEAQGRALVAELAAAQLLQADGEAAPVTVTDAGQHLHERIRTAVTEITERLWGDLPAEDLAAAGRVLS